MSKTREWRGSDEAYAAELVAMLLYLDLTLSPFRPCQHIIWLHEIAEIWLSSLIPVTFAGVQLEEDVALAERERRRVGRLETVERLQHGAAALIHY